MGEPDAKIASPLPTKDPKLSLISSDMKTVVNTLLDNIPQQNKKLDHENSVAQGILSDVLQDVEEYSSTSSSSTTLSESTPHWIKHFEPDPWSDELQPCVKLTDTEDTVDVEVLSDNMILSALSYFAPCPVTFNYPLGKLQLSNKNLSDINKIENYRYIQYVDLSKNNLTDITALGQLPFLMYLDVSHNNLRSVLMFKAPMQLTYANFSNNDIAFIDDLTDFWSIMKLDLSHNSITKIEGLQNLRYLRTLDLSYNHIEHFANLSKLRLTHLYLNNNEIKTYEEGPDIGLKTLDHLCHINLNFNSLHSLGLFQEARSIETVDIVENIISELLEVDSLKTLLELKELDLTQNPLTEWPEYRGMVISTVPSLCLLDCIPVAPDEKVTAKNTFDPEMRLHAAKTHAIFMMLEQLNDHHIHSDILPVDQIPYPLVILVGPLASHKGYLVRLIAQRHPGKVYSGVSHTSREPLPNEEDGVHYHFVSKDKMNEMAHCGAFYAFTEILGHSYGFCRSELAKAMENKCVCLTHMDMIGAMSVYNRGLKPYLILTITQNENKHLERLQVKYKVDNEEMGPGKSKIEGKTHLSGKRTSKGQGDKGDKRKKKTTDRKQDMQTLITNILDNALEQSKSHVTDEAAEQSLPIASGILEGMLSGVTNNNNEGFASVLQEMIQEGHSSHIKVVLKSREDYFTLLEQKYFFSNVLYTDNLETAYNKLCKIVRKAYISRPRGKPRFCMDDDDTFRVIVPERLKRYLYEIDEHHAIVSQQKSRNVGLDML